MSGSTEYIEALLSVADADRAIRRSIAVRILSLLAPDGAREHWGSRKIYRYLHPQRGTNALLTMVEGAHEDEVRLTDHAMAVIYRARAARQRAERAAA